MKTPPHAASLTTLRFWRGYAVTLRPYLFFVSGASGLLGLALVPEPRGVWALPALLAFLLSYGLGQAVTDVFQTDTDALSAPFRPLVRGAIAPRQVLLVSLTGLAACALVFALHNPWTLLVSLVAVLGLVAYTPFKRRWWGGPPWNAWIVACLPLIGYLCGGASLSAALTDSQLWLAMTSVFFSYAVFVLLGYFKDVDADRATGYDTLPVRFGRPRSVAISASLALIAVAASGSLLLGGGGFARLGAPVWVGLGLWSIGLALLVVAHLRIRGTTRDRESIPAIAMVVAGYGALHLGEAAVLRPGFAAIAGALFVLSIGVLAWRPYRSQI